jgi:nitroreductase
MSNAAPDLTLSSSLPAEAPAPPRPDEAAPAPLSSEQLSPAASERVADEAIDPAFLSRSSRRAISARPLPFQVVRTLFEAARWAPSAGNVQPWLFIYAADRPVRKRAHRLLNEQNRRWAERAPLLVFVFARRNHPATGLPLRSAAFDTGAAWFALALQAQRLGLVTRAMGGILHEQTYAALGVPESEFESMVAIAIGYPGDPVDLPPDLAAKELPTSRRRQHHFVFNGRYIEREPTLAETS